MLEARFVRIVTWPGGKTPGDSRKRSQFKAKYVDTLNLLEREVRQLGGQEVLIQTYHEARDIRNDGWPRGDARRPSDPGVVLTFENARRETLSFPCDRYTEWEDNLRAIGVSLEALRAVDRHGVTRTGEQYRGFLALPAPPKQMTPTEAATIIVKHAPGAQWDMVLGSVPHFQGAKRAAMFSTHPDKNNGDDSKFHEVQAAAKILESHLGIGA